MTYKLGEAHKNYAYKVNMCCLDIFLLYTSLHFLEDMKYAISAS